MAKLMETYTVDEVAKALKLHPYTIRRLSREKKIPAFKFGGQWRFRKHLTYQEYSEFILSTNAITVVDEDILVPFELGSKYEWQGLKPLTPLSPRIPIFFDTLIP